MKVVIMAGGKGTRISTISSDIPKPMMKIADKPILEHEIECLRAQGFKDIIITVGYLGYVIMNYFGDGSKCSPVTGKSFGVNISYYIEEEPLGNAGALFKLMDQLDEEFLLLNGDVIFNVDFNRFVKYHKDHEVDVTLFTHPNSHPYDSGLIIADQQGFVQQWLTKEDARPKYYKNRVNAGLHIISPRILLNQLSGKVDLDRQLLKPLAGTCRMRVYDSPEYVKDMGTPERYYEVSKDYEKGLIEGRNLLNKQKAIFLDRDGTINKYVGFLTSIDNFELIDGVAKAISLVNKSDYLVIVITNQPVIARGDVTEEELDRIHNKMETLLGKHGAYVDDIFYCPHHPDKGYIGERVEYKIQCSCRKPKPGLLIQAAEKYNIDLSKSWMIGDQENDILAGKNAGCYTALLGKEDYQQDRTYISLYECIKDIIDK